MVVERLTGRQRRRRGTDHRPRARPAAQHGRAGDVELFMNASARIDEHDILGRTVCHCAAQATQADVLALRVVVDSAWCTDGRCSFWRNVNVEVEFCSAVIGVRSWCWPNSTHDKHHGLRLRRTVRS